MTERILIIGDKTLSSWSLRPWLVMKQAGIAFTERLVRLDRPQTKAELVSLSPSGRVPCLVDGETTIWDSLSIAEYLAETFPEKALWPADKRAKAMARSVAAEMHSGFAALRALWPMHFVREGMRHLTSGIDGDIARIADIWETCRREFGSKPEASGPFLFGQFSIADAMYAPVVSRFQTYGPVPLPPLAEGWRALMWALPAMREWGEGARAEGRE